MISDRRDGQSIRRVPSWNTRVRLPRWSSAITLLSRQYGIQQYSPASTLSQSARSRLKTLQTWNLNRTSRDVLTTQRRKHTLGTCYGGRYGHFSTTVNIPIQQPEEALIDNSLAYHTEEPDPRRRSYQHDELFEPTNGDSATSREMTDGARADERTTEALPAFGLSDADWGRNLSKVLRQDNDAMQHDDVSVVKIRSAWWPYIGHNGGCKHRYRAVNAWWTSKDRQWQAENWSKLMLWHLQNDLSHSLEFLVSTIVDPLPPPKRVADVFHTLTKLAHGKSSKELQSQKSRLRRICRFAVRKYQGTLPLSQQSIWILGRHAHTQDRVAFFRLLDRHQVSMHPDTLSNFAMSFVRFDNEHLLALHALEQALCDQDLDSMPPIVQHVCVLLIRKSVHREPRYSFEVLSRLKQTGLRFDTGIYNALIANASDRQDYTTAWNLFSLLGDPDLQPDPTTYAILFKMCRRTNDISAFRRLWREIREMSRDPDNFQVDPALATEMLYCTWVWTPTNVERMLKTYKKYFDLQPLSQLGLLKETDPARLAAIQYAIPEKSEWRLDTYFHGPRHPPPTLAIALVLMAFLRRPDMKQELLERIYSNFKALVAARDPFIVPLAENSLTWDSFLKAFGHFEETLKRWSELMRDMTQPARLIAADSNSRQHQSSKYTSSELFEEVESGDSPQPLANYTAAQGSGYTFFTPSVPFTAVKPSTRTWSILLNAFINHNQIDAAEKVLELMECHGLKPTLPTWNGLIRGWSRYGKQDKVLEGLSNIQNSGFIWDRYTVRAIKHDRSDWGAGRVGLGDRARGGGLVSGRRLPSGSFEYTEQQHDDLATQQIEKGEPPLGSL